MERRIRSAENFGERAPDIGRHTKGSGSARPAGSRKARCAASPRAHAREPGAALGSRHQPDGQLSLRSFREIAGEFRGDAADIDALITNLSLFLGGSDNPTGAMRLKGPLQFNARIGGRLKSPAVSVTSDAPELQAGILNHLSARTEGKIDGTQITFQGTVTLPENATVHAQGSLDISGHDPVLNLDARGTGYRQLP